MEALHRKGFGHGPATCPPKVLLFGCSNDGRGMVDARFFVQPYHEVLFCVCKSFACWMLVFAIVFWCQKMMILLGAFFSPMVRFSEDDFRSNPPSQPFPAARVSALPPLLGHGGSPETGKRAAGALRDFEDPHLLAAEVRKTAGNSEDFRKTSKG